jgi:hypothetical protein
MSAQPPAGKAVTKRAQLIAASLFLCFTFAASARAAQEPQLTEDQMRQFLLTAKVIQSKYAKKGITNTLRLTLSDGNITHDASFQSIDEHRARFEGFGGTVELNFVDSYKYDIAAYELAKLIGLADMMPVTVLRKYMGTAGSLSWWLPVTMDEETRLKKNISPPDMDAWNKQMYKKRVFSELVYDTDSANATNVLISEDWHLWMIDFSRAFRLHHDLKNPKNLVKCDRLLLENLRKLDEKELTEKTKNLLKKSEVQGVMARRDKIVKAFDQLIAQKGEAEVLY